MSKDDFQRVAIEKLLNRLVTPSYPNIIDHIEVVYKNKDRTKYNITNLVVKVYVRDDFDKGNYDEMDNIVSGNIDWSITDALRYLGGIRYWLEFVWPKRFDS